MRTTTAIPAHQVFIPQAEKLIVDKLRQTGLSNYTEFDRLTTQGLRNITTPNGRHEFIEAFSEAYRNAQRKDDPPTVLSWLAFAQGALIHQQWAPAIAVFFQAQSAGKTVGQVQKPGLTMPIRTSEAEQKPADRYAGIDFSELIRGAVAH